MVAADAAQAPSGPDPQQVAMRAEELRGHLEMVSRQLDVFSSHKEDKDQALTTLRAVKGTRPGDDVLFPVGGNAFIAATLAENKEVVMGVGADYAMPRGIDKAIGSLESDVARLQDEIASLTTTAARLEAEYSQLVQMLQSLRAR